MSDTVDQRLVRTAQLYTFLEISLLDHIHFYKCDSRSRIDSATPSQFLEYPGKSHGILVWLVMSERGRYHKS